eukprot:1158364-Pyramimonas_sp.AAC.1
MVEVDSASSRAASPMHWRCGAILRPHILRPRLGGLDHSESFIDGPLPGNESMPIPPSVARELGYTQA